MRNAVLLLASPFVLFACADDDEDNTPDRVEVASYRGEPNGDDAGLQGTLAVDSAGCLVIETPGGSVLLAIPQSAAAWDDGDRVLTFGDTPVEVGDNVLLGGSEREKSRLEGVAWAREPEAKCLEGRETIWFAGASAILR